MFTKAITAAKNENAAVTDRNITVVNHSPGSITSSDILLVFCRIDVCAVNLKTQDGLLKVLVQESVVYHNLLV